MLRAMREAIAELLPDTCYILTPTDTPDGMGGVTTSYGTSAAIACRLDDKASPMQVTGGAIQIYAGMMFSLPYDTVIYTTDNILHNGIQYAVTGINDDISWQAVKRVAVEAV
jgi:hypothetical protein